MKKRWGALLLSILWCALLLAGCDSQPQREKAAAQLVKTEEMVHIVYSGEKPLTTEELKSCRGIMEQRMYAMNMTDYTISINAEDSTIELSVPRRYYPGTLDKIAYEWCSKGEFSICTRESYDDIAPAPPEDVALDNRHVTSAEAVLMEGEYVVILTFTEEGTQALADVTEKLTAVQGYMAIWMDHQIVCSAQVMEPITDGEALVTGFASWEAASLFAAKINAAMMPCDLYASVDFSDVEE